MDACCLYDHNFLVTKPNRWEVVKNNTSPKGLFFHFGRRAFILNPRLQRQIVYACVSPKAKLFSLQLNNQSKILFRRFLPFALSFQLCSGPEGVHWDL